MPTTGMDRGTVNVDMEDAAMLARRPGVWVGRTQELSACRRAIDLLIGGHGGVLWLEGETGLGKSSLLELATAAARDLGCEVLSGTADELGRPLPLRLVFDCLQVRHQSRDPRRARIASTAHGRQQGFYTSDET